MNKRAYALDALRGYAIITMVLSATVAWNSLPGWMYHAQTPPPDRAFDASLSGITWVDLVFPFFLFAMGAAFPFSIKKRFEKGDTKLRLVYEAIKRGVQLTFFAIFIQHFYPYVLSNTPIRARRFCIVKIYMTEPKTAIFASSNMIMLLNDTSKVLSFAY